MSQPRTEFSLTPKQLRFVEKYIELGNASEAYRQSYDASGMNPATVNRSAKELLDNPKITARLKQIQTENRQRLNVNVDSLTDELEQARQMAIKNEEPAASISATLGKAKLHGLLIHRNEMRVKRPEDMTEAELLKALGFDSIEDMMAADGHILTEHQAG